jgi:hypothetical protein
MRLKHLSIAAALCVVAGASAEIAARFDDYVRLGIPFAHTPNSDLDLRLEYPGWARGRPNGRYKQFAMNSFGFRGPEMERAPKAGCTRVMVLGSSETFGYYETAGKEYPAQLRDSLGSKGCFEVINAGLAGMSLRSMVSLWQNYAADFRPHVVLVYSSPVFYLGNVREEWPQTTATEPLPTVEMPIRPRLIEQLKNAWSTPRPLQERRIQRWIAEASAGKPDDWFYREPPRERLDMYLSDLDSLVAAVRARGAEPVLMTHAMRFGPTRDADDEFILLAWRQFTPRATAETMLAFERQAARETRALAARRGLRLVDVDSAMTGHGALFADFVHFNDTGAGKVAGLLAHELTRREETLARSAATINQAGAPAQ